MDKKTIELFNHLSFSTAVCIEHYDESFNYWSQIYYQEYNTINFQHLYSITNLLLVYKKVRITVYDEFEAKKRVRFKFERSV